MKMLTTLILLGFISINIGLECQLQSGIISDGSATMSLSDEIVQECAGEYCFKSLLQTIIVAGCDPTSMCNTAGFNIIPDKCGHLVDAGSDIKIICSKTKMSTLNISDFNYCAKIQPNDSSPTMISVGIHGTVFFFFSWNMLYV